MDVLGFKDSSGTVKLASIANASPAGGGGGGGVGWRDGTGAITGTFPPIRLTSESPVWLVCPVTGTGCVEIGKFISERFNGGY